MMDHDDKLSASVAVLEQRWNDMAGTIRNLREQIANHKQTISEHETQILQQQEQIEQLTKEKAWVVSRIEGLVDRYEEVDS
ncbi:MAG: cell division protein ZapB [Magnetococcus sp. YQC-5]